MQEKNMSYIPAKKGGFCPRKDMKNKSFLQQEDLWQRIKEEAQQSIRQDSHMRFFLQDNILRHPSLASSLAYIIATRLADTWFDKNKLQEIFLSYLLNQEIMSKVAADIFACYEKDPACYLYLAPLLYYKGFQGIESYRIANCCWQEGRKDFALYLQSRMSAVWNIDIHPAAIIGQGILCDHASGLVIGETSIVGDHVSIFHGVTLGGTGRERNDRHPKVRNGVLLGAHAVILGNIEIGESAKIGAGSIITKPVPANVSVVGISARVLSTFLSEKSLSSLQPNSMDDD